MAGYWRNAARDTFFVEKPGTLGLSFPQIRN